MNFLSLNDESDYIAFAFRVTVHRSFVYAIQDSQSSSASV